MKIKKRFGVLLVCKLALSISNVMAYANTTTDNSSDNTYTVTLQHIDPIREGDEFGWMLLSEPGQLAYSINALGLGNPNPELFEDETIMLYSEDGIDLEKIYEKLDLDNDTFSESEMPIVLTYTKDDISSTNPEITTYISDKNSADTVRTTGSFSVTMPARSPYNTSKQTKDDDEQTAYVTLTKLSPSAYQEFNGILVRVRDYDGGAAMTAWTTITSTGKHTLSYRTFEGIAGDRYYLQISNENDRDTDVAGRWTP